MRIFKIVHQVIQLGAGDRNLHAAQGFDLGVDGEFESCGPHGVAGKTRGDSHRGGAESFQDILDYDLICIALKHAHAVKRAHALHGGESSHVEIFNERGLQRAPCVRGILPGDPGRRNIVEQAILLETQRPHLP
ncbi:hypothetical protein CSQ85_01330 [Bifidobacterium rousetti]|nr:hypothetical protein CSQ85_01330 [Bifidobacterium rousetti]